MSDFLAREEFEFFKEHAMKGYYEGTYLDTWEYEDEYSHNDIDLARYKFIDMCNEYFALNSLPFEAIDGNENVEVVRVQEEW